MNKIQFFGLVAALGFGVGCRPSLSHAFHAENASVVQTQEATQVAVPSAYEACIRKYRLSPSLSAPREEQRADTEGHDVTILMANGLAQDAERVRRLCEKEVELQYLPQPQTCWPSGWGGYICRLFEPKYLPSARPVGALILLYHVLTKLAFCGIKIVNLRPLGWSSKKKERKIMKNVFFAILALALQTGCGSVYHGTFSRDGKAGNVYREETPFQTVTLETVDTTQADRNCFARMANVGPTRQLVCDEQGQGFVRETVGIGRTGSGGRASAPAQAAAQPVATAIAVGGMPGVPGYGYGGFGAPVAVAVPAAPAAAAASGQQGEINKKVVKVLNDHERRLQGVEKK